MFEVTAQKNISLSAEVEETFLKHTLDDEDKYVAAFCLSTYSSSGESANGADESFEAAHFVVVIIAGMSTEQ